MKKYMRKIISILIALLVMVVSVVPALAAQPEKSQGRQVVSKIVEKDISKVLWEEIHNLNFRQSEVDYQWDFKHHNLNISRTVYAVDFAGLIDLDDFKSNDIFLARLATDDPMGRVNMLDQNLDLIFCFSDVIRNGEIRHINGDQIDFYARNGKLMKYSFVNENMAYTTTFKYNRKGQLTQIIHDNCKDTFKYDSKGKLTSFTYEEVIDDAPMSRDFSIQRDKDGRIRSVNNDIKYYYFPDGTFNYLTFGDTEEGIELNSKGLETFYYEDYSSMETAELTYTTIQ